MTGPLRPIALGLVAGLALSVSAPGRVSASGLLLVAQTPLSPSPGSEALAHGTLGRPSGEGGRLVAVEPGKPPVILTGAFHSAIEPDVSFDGTRIVFAGRKAPDDAWCIWEMQADGADPRDVTCGPGGARQPVYLPTMHTLTATSTEPWEQIAFVGTLPGETNESGVGPHTALFACRLDGSRERRLTFNLSSDFDPMVLPDGRLVFASWQRQGLDRGPNGRVVLSAVNIDGTDLMIFAGDEGPRVKRMPALTTDRLVVFVQGDSMGGEASGSLGAVSLRRNLHSYRSLTPMGKGRFRSPSTRPEGGVFVSFLSAPDEGSWAVYSLDPHTGAMDEVFDESGWNDVEALALGPRPVPDGRSSSVRGEEPVGWLYGLDVGISDLGGPAWTRDVPKRLRVLEGLPRRSAEEENVPGLAPRRLLVETDLADDGSFHVEVPADTPLELQLLDEDGLALRSCSWIWARRREARGCIGCHEDPERTPPNRLADAVARGPVRIDRDADRRFVDFRQDVWPVVERRCQSCHGPEGATPRLDGEPARVYRTLLDGAVRPGTARTSPLVWHLLGRNTSRPWDHAGEGAVAGPVPAVSEGLTADERLTIIQWIDFGALWDRAAIAARAAGSMLSGGQR